MKPKRTSLRLESLEGRVVPIATVLDVQFGDGTAQRSMVNQVVVTFSENVNISNVASAFTVHRSVMSVSAGPIGNANVLPSAPVGPTTTVTLTFTGIYAPTGSLIDGIYDVIADPAFISSDVDNTALDGNDDNIAGGVFYEVGSIANQNFRIYGDSDGDGVVGLPDWGAFKSVYILFPSTVFDYLNDGGVINLSDFAQFRARFNFPP